MKSAGLKYEKREANRGINQRYWHVREIDEKLYQNEVSQHKLFSTDLLSIG